jgi:hypothetical protein
MSCVIDRTAFLACFVAENAAAASPLPVCRDCGFPTTADDMDDVLWPDRCATCSMNRIHALIYQAVKRHGRKKVKKALKRLAAK